MLLVRFLVPLLLAEGTLRPAQCNTATQMVIESTGSVL